MTTLAEFQITGRVGNITPAGSTLKGSIAADYDRRNDKGEWEGRPYWNTVTLFNESIVRWASRDNLGQGDLVPFPRHPARDEVRQGRRDPLRCHPRRRPVRPPGGEGQIVTCASAKLL